MGSLKELLALAQSQVGYQEKASASRLDDFHANAGYGNYTRYARDVDGWGLAGCQGQPWCATYQFWLEAKIYGVDRALARFHMNRKDYQAYNCFCIYDAFERAGRTSRKPEPGCLVVFRHSHIGRVTAVRNERIYTNEGNTSALYGDRNGGTVKTKDYSLKDANIRGYCLIDYENSGDRREEGSGGNASCPDTNVTAVRTESFQSWLNQWYGTLLKKYCGRLLIEDGIYGTKTRDAALTVWKDVLNRLYGSQLCLTDTKFNMKCREAAGTAMIRKGSSGTLPAVAEGILAAKGYYRGNIDALFGSALDAAVREFQCQKKLKADGVIGKETWNALFG